MAPIATKLREIKARDITETVARLCQGANFELNEDVLAALQSRLEQRKQEAAETFDDVVSKAADKAGTEKVLNAHAELEQIKAYERRLREILAKEDTQTIELGRKQL